jgi:hypothetical protein
MLAKANQKTGIRKTENGMRISARASFQGCIVGNWPSRADNFKGYSSDELQKKASLLSEAYF